MNASLMARMKELEEDNLRLKKMYVEERLKAEIVAEALTKHGSAISAAGPASIDRWKFVAINRHHRRDIQANSGPRQVWRGAF
jgi:hypothetical protein